MAMHFLRATGRAAVRCPLPTASIALLLAACTRDAGSNGAAAAEAASAEMSAAGAYGVCAPCHHDNGLGVPNAYPSLVGTAWMTGEPELAIKVTLHGLQGPITVNGRPWNAMMMPLQNLPDHQIALALTHARTSWGNTASPITPEMVAKVRAEHAGRSKPWTAEELGNPR
jgi:mono/diheme cytochrome c family protein